MAEELPWSRLRSPRKVEIIAAQRLIRFSGGGASVRFLNGLDHGTSKACFPPRDDLASVTIGCWARSSRHRSDGWKRLPKREGAVATFVNPD
ncbi:hypothetical protein HPP92_002971 [Vanilla planifolia]|uniref:Uncharacterized protein n=1 Tax=Vanilla planifolia TaxID=51239 RepID=A0A835S241_VANPL|nr:hypothetical protein HPP92_003352 [Vanilla planifolia]KAG0502899.1 hypothetical protein HPP92_002971 [Vanilla planifolia]